MAGRNHTPGHRAHPRAEILAGPHAAIPRPDSGTPRMRVLCVLSSSNQMYSGVGKAVFELTRRLLDRVEYEFAIDDLIPKNHGLVAEFCAEHGLALHVGPGRPTAIAHDAYNDDLPDLLRSGSWDAVECLVFANVATNSAVLDAIGDRVLAYTPHHQPVWTVDMAPELVPNYVGTHQRMIERADVTFCDSPWERHELQGRALHHNNCVHVPLGCDFSAFRPGPPQRRPQLLFVGDLLERRKRFDRVLTVFSRLLVRWPDLRLVVVGNRSDRVSEAIPDLLRRSIELRGYVGEEEVRRAYAESLGLFLLSDYEAFGIPILEALASGTPVFLSHQGATHSVFRDFRGAHFCPADDPDATFDVVAGTIARGASAIEEVLDDRPRLEATFHWDVLADRKWQGLAGAWFRRNCLCRPFRGPRRRGTAAGPMAQALA